MDKLINKIFGVLSKPAKLILIIGGFTYALWFAIRTGMSMDGQFMNVLTNLITLVVGTALICLPPVLILLKKDEIAKIAFILLLGYWVLSAPTQYFFFAETFADAREFFPVFVSIFLLIAGLTLVAILVLVILEMLLGIKILRLIILGVALLFVAISFLTAIFFCIEAGIMEAPWIYFVDYAFMDMILLPVVVGCGCIYFFSISGAQK